jgi:hypothetical protein
MVARRLDPFPPGSGPLVKGPPPMSDPVELYMRLIKLIRAGEDAAALQLFAPDFVVHEDPGMPYGGVVAGGQGFLDLRRKVYDVWGPGALKLLFVCGDGEGGHASAHFDLVGHPNGTSETVHGHIIVSWLFQDDLAVWARVFYFDTPRLSAALAG